MSIRERVLPLMEDIAPLEGSREKTLNTESGTVATAHFRIQFRVRVHICRKALKSMKRCTPRGRTGHDRRIVCVRLLSEVKLLVGTISLHLLTSKSTVQDGMNAKNANNGIGGLQKVESRVVDQQVVIESQTQTGSELQGTYVPL